MALPEKRMPTTYPPKMNEQKESGVDLLDLCLLWNTSPRNQAKSTSSRLVGVHTSHLSKYETEYQVWSPKVSPPHALLYAMTLGTVPPPTPLSYLKFSAAASVRTSCWRLRGWVVTLARELGHQNQLELATTCCIGQVQFAFKRAVFSVELVPDSDVPSLIVVPWIAIGTLDLT
jgi:hypothetical protein